MIGDTFTALGARSRGAKQSHCCRNRQYRQAKCGALRRHARHRSFPADSETPADGQLVNQPTIEVRGRPRTRRVRHGGRGQRALPVVLIAGRFDATVTLSEGDNPILVRAADTAGNEREVTVTVQRFDLPQVEITDPPTLAYLAATTVEVRGTVSPPDSTVTVNGVAAEVAGGAFVAADIPLVEGGNILTATATDPAGHVSTDSVNVVRDLTPPHVQIYLPADGATVYDEAVRVSGLVNDIVPGTVNAGQVSVTVNGVPAQVANRSFLVPSLPLAAGDNRDRGDGHRRRRQRRPGADHRSPRSGDDTAGGDRLR